MFKSIRMHVQKIVHNLYVLHISSCHDILKFPKTLIGAL